MTTRGGNVDACDRRSVTVYIDLLRMALASIWTELEEDEPSEEDCRQIIDEALAISVKYARPKDLTLGERGLDGWKEYLDKFFGEDS